METGFILLLFESEISLCYRIMHFEIFCVLSLLIISITLQGYVDDMVQDVVDCLSWIQSHIREFGGDKVS